METIIFQEIWQVIVHMFNIVSGGKPRQPTHGHSATITNANRNHVQHIKYMFVLRSPGYSLSIASKDGPSWRPLELSTLSIAQFRSTNTVPRLGHVGLCIVSKILNASYCIESISKVINCNTFHYPFFANPIVSKIPKKQYQKF